MEKNKFAIILITINVLLAFFFFSIAPKGSIPTHEYKRGGLSYSNFGSQTTKIIKFSDCPKGVVKSFAFSGKFFPTQDSFNNLFQTGNENSVLRVELQPGSNLVLVAWDRVPKAIQVIVIEKNIPLHQWHKIELQYVEGVSLTVGIDGKETICLAKPTFAIKTTDLVIGAGYNRTRLFAGLIDSVSISARIAGESIGISILRRIGEKWQWLILVQLLIFLAVRTKIRVFTNPLPSGWLDEIFSILIAVFACIIVWQISKRFSTVTSAKWMVYFTFAVSSLALLIYYRLVGSVSLFSKRIGWVAVLGIVSLLILVSAYGAKRVNSEFAIIFFSLFISFIFFMVRNSSKVSKFSFSFLIMSIFLSLTELPNFVKLKDDLLISPTRALVTGLISLLLISKFLFPPGPENSTRWTRYILYFVSITLFVIFSFRTDTLFLESTEFHWSYFSEAIESVKGGGLLLWDVPSQYGFLSILICAALPIKSGVMSLLMLYALMLILVAVLFFHSLISERGSLGFKILMATIVLCSIFFADPNLIGPQPYPSSSMLRFFWCYVLFFYVFLSRNKVFFGGGLWYFGLSILWVMGSLWSAESLIYCTMVFSTVSFVLLFFFQGEKNRAISKVHLLFPLTFMVLALAGISLYYLSRIGHLPDIEMAFMYGKGYAQGFGEIPIHWFGTPWTLMFPLLGLLFTALLLLKNKKMRGLEWKNNKSFLVVMAGFAWLFAISSYYLGRAVPNNITAMLPQIICVLMISSNALSDDGYESPAQVLKIIGLPFLLLVLCTGLFGYSFPDKLRKMSFFENVQGHSFQAPSELQNMVEKAGLTPKDAVVFYGDPCVLPRWQYGGEIVKSYLSWLPRPLQLLEEPITPQKRDEILGRHQPNRPLNGFLIEQKGFLGDRLVNWKSNLQFRFDSKQISESSNYRIFYYHAKH